MSDLAIRVEGLGKQYRLGGSGEPYSTLGDQIRKWTSPRRLLRMAAGAKRPTFWALKDVSFEVNPGEVVGVIGRNGAGKSTLLKILSRITEPTEGEADIQGRVGSLLEVGTGFHPELTGRENVYLNGAILGMRRAEIARQFDAIVAFAEVAKFIDTPVKHYSSGMYMRLAFAVAAHLEPEILIVDEVLAVGDAQFQKKCLGKMSEVARGGRTVLFVSHDMGAIQTLCQRCVALSQGRVAAVGPAGSVVTDYLSSAAAGGAFTRESTVDSPIMISSAVASVVDEEGGTWLDVKVDVRSSVEAIVSIDLRITDMVGRPVGFAPVGSFNNELTVRLPVGVTRIDSRHDVGILANGSYNLSIDVADPTVGYHDRAESCVTFEVNAPARRGAYRRMQQSWGFGSVEIPYVGHSVTTSPRS